MSKRYLTFILIFLSFLVAGSAMAGPHMREARQQRAAMSEERMRERLQQNEANRQIPPPAMPAQPAAAPVPERHGGFGEVGQSGNLNQNQFQQPQPGRAGARMSVEDRRRLRRQINEAGQDIYIAPKK